MSTTTTKHPLRDLLHEATHRVPGVPAHVEHPAGHQGRVPVRDRSHDDSHSNVRHNGANHSPARPPRVLAGWQRRIAALFGQEA
jgi:hypothetical protein